MPQDLLGIGIYSQPEAASLLRLTPNRLRRWVNGYTYRLRMPTKDKVRRARPPVLQKSDLPVMRNTVAISFLELMELRVIRSLVDDHGLPLQRVRRIALLARREFDTDYPFASRTVFVEGERVFASISREEGDPDVVELRSGKSQQVQWARMFEPVIKEVAFDPTTCLTERWWPLAPNRGVVLDPAVMFGAPVISGSRVRTNFAASMAESSEVGVTAQAFGVSEDGVQAALEYERYLAAA